jgi:hypothetical protein
LIDFERLERVYRGNIIEGTSSVGGKTGEVGSKVGVTGALFTLVREIDSRLKTAISLDLRLIGGLCACSTVERRSSETERGRLSIFSKYTADSLGSRFADD